MEKIPAVKPMTAKEAKDLIKKYIAPTGSAFDSLAWFFALLGIVTGVLGTMLAKDDSPLTAREFSPVYSKTGSYAYLDAVAISDWICRYEVAGKEYIYYTAADSEDYLYMVRMDPETLNDMVLQNAWWNGDKTGTPPEPYRLYGEVNKISASNLSDFAAAWDRSDDEFKQFFGDKYLNVGASPSALKNKIFRIAAIASGVLWFIMFLISTIIHSTAKTGSARKSIKKLRSQGELIMAAEELSGSSGFVNDLGYCRVTNNFVFGRKTGSAVSFNDILWYYEKNDSDKKSKHNCVIAYTKDRKNVNLTNLPESDTEPIVKTITKALKKSNTYAVYGNTKENQKEYRALYRHFKEGGGEVSED